MPTFLLQAGHAHPREPGFEAATGTEGEIQLVTDIQRRLVALLRRHDEFRAIPVPGNIPDGIKVDAALFLHADGAANRAARGFSFGYPQNGRSRRLANLIRAEFLRIPGHPPERDDNATADMRGYYGYRRVVSPSMALVEHGFMTNPDERAWLTQHVDELAAAHYRALCRLVGVRPKRLARAGSRRLARTAS